MGGRPSAWLVRAWVAGFLMLLRADTPLPRPLRLASVGAHEPDSMLVGIASSAPARRASQRSPRATAQPTRSSPPLTTKRDGGGRLLPSHAARTLAEPVVTSPAEPASRRASEAAEPAAQTVPAPAQASRPGRASSAPRCEVDLWLAGSVVNAARPRLSLAMVRRSAGTAVVSLGGRIDDFTVQAIEPTRARLRASDGSECTLLVVPPGPRPVVAAAPPPVGLASEPVDKPPPGKAMFASGELTRGVRVLGSGSYALARSLVLKALTNPGGAAGGAWFRLSEREGQRIGMEVRAVREGTPLSVMGIRTGDVVRSVNGIALDTPAGLIEALRAARESDTIAISIQRDGQASDMRYTIE